MVTAMALLNALFPSAVHLEDSEDFDPSPYSAGLRDSIRFSIYEHLMGQNPPCEEQQEGIQLKLLCWCDIPDYDQSRHALLRYTQEAKKLEEICFQVMGAIERRSKTLSIATSTDSSLISASEQSTNRSLECDPRSQRVAYDPRQSIQSQARGSLVSIQSLLLAQIPGRELLPAPTNRGDSANDLDESCSPVSLEHLASIEFHQHPLARELSMTPTEQASLGLLIPKQLLVQDL